MAPPRKVIRTEWFVNRDELALLLGRDYNYVAKMNARGMPKGPRKGVYDLVKCIDWYVNDQRSMVDSDPNLSEEMQEERIGLVRAQKRRTEIDASQRAGHLIDQRDLRPMFLAVLSALDGELVNMPARLVESIRNAATVEEALTIAQEWNHDVRAALSDGLQALADDPSSGRAPTETTTEADGLAVG